MIKLCVYILLSLLVGSSQTVAATPLCVTNASEFEARRAELPKCIQTLPIILTVDGFIAKGAITVRKTPDGVLLLEGHSIRDPEGKNSEPIAIKSACVEKDSSNISWVNVALQNGHTEKLKVTSDTTVDYGAVELKVSDQATFNKIVLKIRATSAGSSSSVGQE